MPVVAYKSSSTRRIFTNLPFKRGMLYEDLMINENVSRTVVNLDIPSSGDYAQPRPAFVNAAIDTFYKVSLNYPTILIKQNTSLAKSFIIGFEQSVNEDDYVNDIYRAEGSLQSPQNFGIRILENQRGFEERERRDGIFKILDITNILDGDTFEFEIEKFTTNGTPFVITERVRLLGIDTPELGPVFEPFADTALVFAQELLRPDGFSQIFGNYTVLNRYIQYEPATVSTDRTDSERILAYVILHVMDQNSVSYFYTLTELLLKAGLGVLQADPDYIYYDRFIEAYNFAKDNDLGIHPLEVAEEIVDGNLDWDTLSAPVIEPADGETEVTIFPTQSGGFETKFKITNDTGYPVQLVVEVGSQTQQLFLNENETEEFQFNLFIDITYRIRARFFPANIQIEQNPSIWTELNLGKITLELNANTLSNSLLTITPQDMLPNGFNYTLNQNFNFTLFIRSTRFNEITPLFEGFYSQGDEITGTYTSITWPVFETTNVVINTRYETPAELGAIRSVTITTQVNTNGKAPVIKNLATSANNVNFTIENQNNFQVQVEYEVRKESGGETYSIGPLTIAANTEVNYTQAVASSLTTYRVNTFFRYPPNTSIISSTTTGTVNTPAAANITATFDTKGGTPNITSQVGPSPLNVNTPTVTLTRNGFTFAGWDPTIGTITQNTEFEAQWTANTYTVILDSNTGTAGTTSVTATFAAAMPTPITLPTKQGFSFLGYWDTSANTGGTEYYNSNGGSARTWNKAQDDTTLYARWGEVVNTYDITWKPNDGTWSEDPPGTDDLVNNIAENTNPSPSLTLSRTGYTQNEQTPWSPALAVVSQNATYTAQWTANTYTVNFNKQDGTGGSNSVTATFDAAMPAATAPTKANANFDGYFDAATDGTRYYNANMSSAKNWDKTSNTTLFARWIDFEEYEIEASANIGLPSGSNLVITINNFANEVENIQTTALEGSTVTFSAPTVTGYTFDGWYDLINETTNTNQTFTINNLSADAKHEARYTEIPTRTLSGFVTSVNAPFGDAITQVTVSVTGVTPSANVSIFSLPTILRTKVGDTAETLNLSVPSPIITGPNNALYSFVGWYRSNGNLITTNNNNNNFSWTVNEIIEIRYSFMGFVG